MFSSAEVNSPNEWDDDEGQPKCGCCRRFRCSAVAVALCLSLTTMFVGISLFIVSLQQRQREDLDSQAIPNTNSMDEDGMQAYWQELVESLIPATDIVIPASPVYKALQWMVLRDPLRPLSDEMLIQQRFTLSVLYYSWTGPSWALPLGSGWLKEAGSDESLFGECSWEGIECNAEDLVIGIDLDDELFGLGGGAIPTQLGLLTALQTLRLPRQGLRGGIPSELAQLANLVTLDLPSNRLTSFDLSTLKVDNLELLRLTDNQIRGRMEFGLLGRASSLRVLELNQNKDLQGNVFSVMANLTMLESLDVSATSLEGSIPDDIGILSNLKIFSFRSKDPSGIPTSIGRCTSLEQILSVQPDTGAGLVGGLPTEIGGLTNLEVLDIRQNIGLGSTIPTELGFLTRLVRLDLKRSNIEGTLPTELGQLTNLETFTVELNPITGTVPTEYGRLTNLEFLMLVGSRVTGSMPQEVCDADISRLVASCKSFRGNEGKFKCDCCTQCQF